ncbi:unnamed protein product [Blepharisma stoltei]|uniref:Uncharacterized protein n=1 Tax=Blepharisma stoltei TaxID=1481888 RepID=A0AAU9JH59_9CILI|nr:unnamed protein product [Blepharisma stoltei]
MLLLVHWNKKSYLSLYWHALLAIFIFSTYYFSTIDSIFILRIKDKAKIILEIFNTPIRVLPHEGLSITFLTNRILTNNNDIQNCHFIMIEHESRKLNISQGIKNIISFLKNLIAESIKELNIFLFTFFKYVCDQNRLHPLFKFSGF